MLHMQNITSEYPLRKPQNGALCSKLSGKNESSQNDDRYAVNTSVKFQYLGCDISYEEDKEIHNMMQYVTI